MAASRTVEARDLHSVHALFLRPGRAGVDIRFEVERIKEGRNYHARLVNGFQRDDRIFQCQTSFSRTAEGVHHQDAMPDAPAPETCRNRDELRGRDRWRDLPIDIRMCDPITANDPMPPRQRVWLRCNGALPEDPALQRALLVYASDRLLLDTAWRPHADRGLLAGASWTTASGSTPRCGWMNGTSTRWTVRRRRPDTDCRSARSTTVPVSASPALRRRACCVWLGQPARLLVDRRRE